MRDLGQVFDYLPFEIEKKRGAEADVSLKANVHLPLVTGLDAVAVAVRT